MKNPASTARLEQNVKRLSTLIEVNARISSTLNLDQILENMMAISVIDSEKHHGGMRKTLHPARSQRGAGDY